MCECVSFDFSFFVLFWVFLFLFFICLFSKDIKKEGMEFNGWGGGDDQVEGLKGELITICYRKKFIFNTE